MGLAKGSFYWGVMMIKIAYMILTGLFLMTWYYVGYLPFFAPEQGGLSHAYMVDAMLVLMIGGGNAEGANPAAVLLNSITSFIPKFISLSVALIVARGVWDIIVLETYSFQIGGIIDVLADLYVSGILIILTMASLKKST